MKHSKKAAKAMRPAGGKCPQCGSRMIPASGCYFCPICGFEVCSI